MQFRSKLHEICKATGCAINNVSYLFGFDKQSIVFICQFGHSGSCRPQLADSSLQVVLQRVRVLHCLFGQRQVLTNIERYSSNFLAGRKVNPCKHLSTLKHLLFKFFSDHSTLSGLRGIYDQNNRSKS